MLTNIDLSYFIQTFLPPKYRTDRLYNYLLVIFRPIEDIKVDINAFFQSIKYSLSFNGQVIYLEHILNDIFHETERLIYISDGSENPLVYIFNNSEPNEDLIIANTSEASIDPIYLSNVVETDIEVDFIVNIPVSITVDEIRLKSIVNKYKCASKRFSINYY